MATIRAVDFERCRLVRGIKTAALVLVLTAGAVITDRVFFFEPDAHPAAAPITKAEPPASTALDGFALPEHLRRPTTADVVTEAPTF